MAAPSQAPPGAAPAAATTAPGRAEQTVYGVKAALALLEHRPQDVRRIYHASALRGLLAPHLAWAASRHLPYRELDGDALAKVADGTHHEGLVVVAEALRYRALTPELARAGGPAALWLAMDRVENPHNLGALLRTAAFFGLSGVLAGGAAAGDKVNAAVLRVSEGGAELVPLFGAPDLPAALRTLREGRCRVLGLETDGALPLAAAIADGLTSGPLALVLGQERDGLSTLARSACDALCVLEGGGPLPSLNVSVAAAVALTQVLHGRARPTPLAAAARAPDAPGRSARHGPPRDRPQDRRPRRPPPGPRHR